MEEIINGLRQIKTRVDSGTITTVNGTESLLSKQLEYMLKKAINYTPCCKSDSEQFYCQTEHEKGGERCNRCCNEQGECFFKQ